MKHEAAGNYIKEYLSKSTEVVTEWLFFHCEISGDRKTKDFSKGGSKIQILSLYQWELKVLYKIGTDWSE